jgi:hypothetical protein
MSGYATYQAQDVINGLDAISTKGSLNVRSRYSGGLAELYKFSASARRKMISFL